MSLMRPSPCGVSSWVSNACWLIPHALASGGLSGVYALQSSAVATGGGYGVRTPWRET